MQRIKRRPQGLDESDVVRLLPRSDRFEVKVDAVGPPIRNLCRDLLSGSLACRRSREEVCLGGCSAAIPGEALDCEGDPRAVGMRRVDDRGQR